MKDMNSKHTIDLFLLTVTGILFGAIVGAITNSINGLVSPRYYEVILGWEGVNNIWRASIAQGIFEGVIFGTLLSLLFVTIVGLITKVKCSYKLGVKYLTGIIALSIIFWILGGIMGLLLSLLSPEFFQSRFHNVPKETIALMKYAWVGGSIWGIELGGFISVILGSLIFKSKWTNNK